MLCAFVIGDLAGVSPVRPARPSLTRSRNAEYTLGSQHVLSPKFTRPVLDVIMMRDTYVDRVPLWLLLAQCDLVCIFFICPSSRALCCWSGLQEHMVVAMGAVGNTHYLLFIFPSFLLNSCWLAAPCGFATYDMGFWGGWDYSRGFMLQDVRTFGAQVNPKP